MWVAEYLGVARFGVLRHQLLLVVIGELLLAFLLVEFDELIQALRHQVMVGVLLVEVEQGFDGLVDVFYLFFVDARRRKPRVGFLADAYLHCRIGEGQFLYVKFGHLVVEGGVAFFGVVLVVRIGVGGFRFVFAPPIVFEGTVAPFFEELGASVIEGCYVVQVPFAAESRVAVLSGVFYAVIVVTGLEIGLRLHELLLLLLVDDIEDDFMNQFVAVGFRHFGYTLQAVLMLSLADVGDEFGEIFGFLGYGVVVGVSLGQVRHCGVVESAGVDVVVFIKINICRRHIRLGFLNIVAG